MPFSSAARPQILHDRPLLSGGSEHGEFCLSLVLPAWNEEDVIAQAVSEANAALSGITADYEIIVVDDGSTDGTVEIVEAIARDNERVRLVRQPQNLGYGAALRAGFEAARFDLVAFTDADCQFHLEDLEYMLPLTRRHDVVTGYRIDRQDPLLRRFYSWGYNTLIKVLLRSPVRDVDCALKVFRRESLLRILPQSRRFFANSEMVTESRILGLSMIEVGVRHRPRAAGTTSVSLMDIPRTLSSLLPYWWGKLQFPGRNAEQAGQAQGSSGLTAMAFVLLMLLGGFMLFRNLSYPLFEPDEGRYAEIAREMLITGDWIVPRLHHEPYLDKPPLFYWLCAISYSVFGVTDQAARLVPAFAAWLTVGVTFLFGRRLLGLSAAFLGTLTMLLSVGFICIGRFIVLDSLLTFFVTLSLFTGYEAIRGGGFRRGWWLFSALACGLGMLTKGPVALALLAPPLIAYAWLNRQGTVTNWKRWTVFGGIVAATSMPWYVAMSAAMPDFVRYFFWEHNVARFLAGSNHPQPFWFYVPVVLLGCMPWGLLLLPMTRFLADQNSETRSWRTDAVGFLVLWFAWCIGFFSLSSGKLVTYILPSLPALMLLIGQYLHARCSPLAADLLSRDTARLTFSRGILMLSPVVAVLTVPLYAAGLVTLPGMTAMIVLFAGAFVATLVFRSQLSARTLWITFCLLACTTTSVIAQRVFPGWSCRHSVLTVQHRQALEQQEYRGHRIVCVSGTWGSIPFYLNRDDVEVVKHGHLNHLAQQNFIGDATVLIVDHSLSNEDLGQLLPPNVQMHELSVGNETSIVTVDVANGNLEPVKLEPVKRTSANRDNDGHAATTAATAALTIDNL